MVAYMYYPFSGQFVNEDDITSWVLLADTFGFILTSPSQQNLTGSTYSSSSTKFAFFM